MNIGWITDAECGQSGRQFSIQNFIDAKPADVTLVPIDLENPAECDAYIVHTATAPRNLPTFPKTLKKGLAKPKQVIMYAHSGWIWAFGASAVIYQSPLQASQHKFGKKFILPPPIVESDYKFDEIERKGQIWIGGFEPTEGLDIAIRHVESDRIHTNFYGWNIPNTSGSNFAHFVGTIEHSEIPRLYAGAQRIVYYCRDPHPFNRAIAEALLAGCECNYSGKVGIASFDEPIGSVLEQCLTSAAKFWEIVGDLVS